MTEPDALREQLLASMTRLVEHKDREVTELRAAAVTAKEQFQKTVSLLGAEKIRADKAERELAEAREDTARLDFLETNKALLNTAGSGQPHVCMGSGSADDDHFHGATYRSAIDAARKAVPCLASA